MGGRARASGVTGRVVTLKIKGTDFRSLTRRRTLPEPTQTARVLFAAAREMLKAEAGPAYRLIGVALSDLQDAEAAGADFFAQEEAKARVTETAVDKLRARFGADAVKTARALRSGR